MEHAYTVALPRHQFPSAAVVSANVVVVEKTTDGEGGKHDFQTRSLHLQMETKNSRRTTLVVSNRTYLSSTEMESHSTYGELPVIKECPETARWLCNHTNILKTMTEYVTRTSQEGGSCAGVIHTDEFLSFRCRRCMEVIYTPYFGIGWGNIDSARTTVIVFRDQAHFIRWFRKSIVSSHRCN